MKKIILILILIQISLFANKYIGIGHSASSIKYDNGFKAGINMYTIYYSNTINNYIIKAGIDVIPSQTPFSKDKKTYNNINTKGYGAGVTLSYKIYNKDERFIAPSVSIGYGSIISTFDDKEITGIPLDIGIVFGMDYKKDSVAFIKYDFWKSDLDAPNSTESANQLNIGISHSINKDFSVQSSYSTDIDKKDNIDDSASFFLGVGYVF